MDDRDIRSRLGWVGLAVSTLFAMALALCPTTPGQAATLYVTTDTEDVAEPISDGLHQPSPAIPSPRPALELASEPPVFGVPDGLMGTDLKKTPFPRNILRQVEALRPAPPQYEVLFFALLVATLPLLVATFTRVVSPRQLPATGLAYARLPVWLSRKIAPLFYHRRKTSLRLHVARRGALLRYMSSRATRPSSV